MIDFPVSDFLDKLKQTPVIPREEKAARIISDFHIESPPSLEGTTAQFSIECSLGRVNVETNRERLVRIRGYCFEEASLQFAVMDILKGLDYSCYLLETETNRLIPMNQKTKEMLEWFEPLLPYTKIYMARNQPIINFRYLRHELVVFFHFEREEIEIYYHEQKIAILGNRNDAIAFIKHWSDRAQVVDDIFNDALCIARKYDSAAFRSKHDVCLFSDSFHLGFSYYLRNNEYLYYTIHRYGRNRLIFETTDILLLKKKVLEHFENFIKTKRLPALLEARTENYLYRICASIFDYLTDFEDYIVVESGLLSQVKDYARTNYYNLAIEKLVDFDTQKLKKCLNNDPFGDKIDHVHRFGKYVFLFGDNSTYDDHVLLIAETSVFQL